MEQDRPLDTPFLAIATRKRLAALRWENKAARLRAEADEMEAEHRRRRAARQAENRRLRKRVSA